MNNLTDKFWPYIKVLAIPYLFILFILLYPIDYMVTAPGGIVEVDSLITVEYNEDKVVDGSISSTYVMSIKRPTFFQFMLSQFSDYNNVNALPTSYASYTNEELSEMSFLDKYESVNAAIIVAYQKANLIHPEIVINYEEKILVRGKASYLSFYDDIDFGDEFIKVIGDNDLEITDLDEVGSNTTESDAYEFFFKKVDGTIYSRVLEKDPDEGRFGIEFKNYNIVNEEETFPKYQENSSNIGGPSGGLLQTLAIYNMLVEEDITKGLKIAGTGEINLNGSVGYIGGVEQKILTAYLNKVDVFFIPYLDSERYTDNYLEALRACEKHGIDPEPWLVPVATFQDALDYLEGLDG